MWYTRGLYVTLPFNTTSGLVSEALNMIPSLPFHRAAGFKRDAQSIRVNHNVCIAKVYEGIYLFKLNPSSVTKAKRLHIDMDRAGTTYGGKKHRYLSDTLMGSFSDHLVWVVSSVRKCIRGVSYP